MLEFVIGMAIGLAYERAIKLPRRVNAALFVAAMALFTANWELVSLPRFLGNGIPAGLLLASATFGGYAPAGSLWRVAGVLGDASYALYLFHAFPIHAMLFLFHHTGVDLNAYRTPCLIGTTLVSFALAMAIFYGFERPVTQRLRALARRGPRLQNIKAAPDPASVGNPQLPA